MPEKTVAAAAAIFFAWVLPLIAAAAPASSNKAAAFDPKKEKGPIEVTSDRMRSEEGGLKVIFSGEVVGKWGELEIISDILEVYNTKEKGETEKVIAIGNVTITRGLKKAKGDRATYIEKEQKIIMTGSPKATAWEGDNIIDGREMIFLLDADKFLVNERVHMKIFPAKKEKEPAEKAPKKSAAAKPGTALNKKKNPASLPE